MAPWSLHALATHVPAPDVGQLRCPGPRRVRPLRGSSNTPQQALTLLNDPTFVEAARVLAARLLAKPAAEDRLNAAFILAVGRGIKPTERAALEKLIAEQRAYYAANPAEATKLLKIGLTPPPADDPAVHAAWTQACRVLLNSHEVITRY